MNRNEIVVAEHVQELQQQGRWIDHGRWTRAKNGTPEYHPTPQEIATKCRLLRTRAERHGAHARSPRGGKYAVMTLAEIN
jgi:hypothetical protein